VCACTCLFRLFVHINWFSSERYAIVDYPTSVFQFPTVGSYDLVDVQNEKPTPELQKLKWSINLDLRTDDSLY
jgi:hypothetical protein